MHEPSSSLSVPNSSQREALGTVVRGSLQGSIQVKISGSRSVEDLRAGNFVVIEGGRYEFFAMITDVLLEGTSPDLLADLPGPEEILLRHALAGTAAYGIVSLKPLLMRLRTPGAAFEPVKTVPVHFSDVGQATQDDVAAVFGSETEGGKHYQVGSPVDMDDIAVCLDLERFVERSNGIFGKSGTGKTFLTRICLCGLLKHRKAVNLVFDMHNEYGWSGTSEESPGGVRGLKQIFGNRIAVFSLDPASARRRNVPLEASVTIPYSQITVEDIMLLRHELNLTDTAAETTYILERRFGSRWLASLLAMNTDEIKEFAETSGANALSLAALYRKLGRMAGECRGFLVESVLGDEDDAVKRIMANLKKGVSVVLEFGQYHKPLQYMLVSNILTRRVHEEYVTMTEAAAGDPARKPMPLVITIEEAHKFLNPALADQTSFGTIARELRKYNVTLLVVDQRPSGIDSEVLSQLGTRCTCLLNDERDIEAVLTGIAGASTLRSVLASLDSKQQALLLGHAVPMPVVIKTRTYDDAEFRRSMGEFSRIAQGMDAGDWK